MRAGGSTMTRSERRRETGGVLRGASRVGWLAVAVVAFGVNVSAAFARSVPHAESGQPELMFVVSNPHRAPGSATVNLTRRSGRVLGAQAVDAAGGRRFRSRAAGLVRRRNGFSLRARRPARVV